MPRRSGGSHAENIPPTAKDARPCHARVRAWRAQERSGRERRQGQGPAAGHRDRAQGSRASKYESKTENKRNLAKSERKEARGETYQQEREGKSHVGARGRRESSRAMGGKNATRTTKRGRQVARTRVRKRAK
jgi:hypothetical protein